MSRDRIRNTSKYQIFKLQRKYLDHLLIHIRITKKSYNYLLFCFYSIIKIEDVKLCFPNCIEMNKRNFYELLQTSELEYRNKKDSSILKYFLENIEFFLLEKRIYIIKHLLGPVTNIFYSGLYIKFDTLNYYEIFSNFIPFFTPNVKWYITFVILCNIPIHIEYSYDFITEILYDFEIEKTREFGELVSNKVDEISNEIINIYVDNKYDPITNKFGDKTNEQMIKKIKKLFKKGI